MVQYKPIVYFIVRAVYFIVERGCSVMQAGV